MDLNVKKLEQMIAAMNQEFFAYHLLWQVPLAILLFLIKMAYSRYWGESGRRRESLDGRSTGSPISQSSIPFPSPPQTSPSKSLLIHKTSSFYLTNSSGFVYRRKRKRRPVLQTMNSASQLVNPQKPRSSSHQAPPPPLHPHQAH